MKKITILFLIISTSLFSQVGVGTTSPNSQLEIKASNQVTPTNKDGILIPRLDKFPVTNPSANQDSMVVFITGNGTPKRGFYYWNNSTATWKPFVRKIDDLEDGKSDSDGSNNGSSVFLGVNAGKNDDSSNNFNVGVGYQTLFSNTIGLRNVAVGYESLKLNNGQYNTAVGALTLTKSTASYNTAFGGLSLIDGTTGANNTALGYVSLYRNTIGSNNTAVGSGALHETKDGNSNTVLGAQAGYTNISGNGNVFIGLRAGYYVIGSNNVAIGYQAYDNPSASNYSNSTALGNSTNITASNQVRIGNSSVTSIGGFRGWTNLSDGRFKKNVKENVKGLDFILKLRPVTYNLDVKKIDAFLKVPDSISNGKNGELIKFKKQAEKEIQTGFIAQEVEQAAKELGYDFSGVDKPKNENDYYGLRYAEFVVPLVKSIQEQQKMIEGLKEENKLLKKELQEIKELIKSKL